MIRQGVEFAKRYRLFILLFLLAFPGSHFLAACYICDTPTHKCYIRTEDLVFLGENEVKMVKAWLVNPIEDKFTVNSVKWRITRYPDTKVVLPDGVTLDPSNEETTYITIKAQPLITATPSGWGPHPMTTLFFEAEYSGTDKASGLTITGKETDQVTIVATAPLIVCHDYYVVGAQDPGAGALIEKANPLAGKVNCIHQYVEGVDISQTLEICVLGGEGSRPYAFSANVPASSRDTMIITGLEGMNESCAKIHLKFHLSDRMMQAVSGKLMIPLFVKAQGKNGRYATDVVKVVCER